MNKTQKVILAVFLALSVLSWFITVQFGIDDSVLIFKFGLRLTMLSAALVLMKGQREHLLIVVAFLFSVVSDYFFVLAQTFAQEPANRQLFGMVGFIMAYPALILAFSRGIRLRRLDLMTAAPFVLTFAIVLWFLLPYASGVLFLPAIILGVILCIFGWTSLAALYRAVYSAQSARLIALAGLLIFASDMVVAFDVFHPALDGFVLWKELFVWITYVPGWTLYLMVMADESLLMPEIARPRKARAETVEAAPALFPGRRLR